MKEKSYEELIGMKDELFKRGFGITKDVFKKMVEEYQKHEEKKRKRGGVTSRLSVSTKVLIMLEYYREYRTQYHMSLSYGVSESSISRIINEIENVLIKSGEFSLPGKDELKKEEKEEGLKIEYIVIDVTEIAIERPKKNKKNTIVERKKNTQ